MALVDSGRAIGAATRLLQDQLMRRGFEVSIGRPEAAAKDNALAKLNLFLFEAQLDAHLRNTALRDGEPPALWLVLKYLLTAFDNSDSSDSAAAHDLLGRGLAALQEMSVLRLDAGVPLVDRQALEPNPEPLKLTFEASPSELLSKVMQGSDERYRLSAAFQLRPVLIAPTTLPSTALLVGIDYSQPSQPEIGLGGLGISVQATLGPLLSRVVPAQFEAGATVDVFGTDLLAGDLEVLLGDVVLSVIERRVDRLRVRVEGDAAAAPEGPIAAGGSLSAGECPLAVRRRLTATRTRSSNLLVPQLLPTLASAQLVGADLVLEGTLLGTEADDVIVAYYRESDGVTVASFDRFEATADQHTLNVPDAATAAPAGDYRVILRVNNQQARSSPRVTVA
jgi:hypothetical protein